VDPTFKDLYDRVSGKHYNTIMKASAPLANLLNIKYFAYERVDAAGNFSAFCNNPDYMHFYLDNQFYLNDPYLVSPSKYQDGKNIQIVSHQLHELDEGTAIIFKGASQKFNLAENISFILKEHDYYEVFIFALYTQQSKILLEVCMNQLGLLERYITHFKKTYRHMLNDFNELNVNISQLRGDDFKLCHPNYNLITQDLHDTFLEAVSPEEHMLKTRMKELTMREAECLHWMIEGKTALETGEILGISRRTVETYREKCRAKLGPHYTLTNLCYLIGKYGLL